MPLRRKIVPLAFAARLLSVQVAPSESPAGLLSPMVHRAVQNDLNPSRGRTIRFTARRIVKLSLTICEDTQYRAFSESCDYNILWCCRLVIPQLDNTIAQYLGDGLLVYIGYPVAHED